MQGSDKAAGHAHTPSDDGNLLMKAVSDRFISAAICCIRSSGSVSSRMHTAAGFPENLLVVNASTCVRLQRLVMAVGGS